MNVRKIVSGGQTGADQAGLMAGMALGIETGGWACQGWATETGPALWLKDYGLKECTCKGYPSRTVANIRDSDATIIFGRITEPGSRLTWDVCGTYRPCMHIEVEHGEIPWLQADYYFEEWLERTKVQVLNVAGNRESVNPGIGLVVAEFLMRCIK